MKGNSLSVSPLYKAPQVTVKVCYLNARSLHKHIEDIRTDLNYTISDVNIFAETRFSQFDNDNCYMLHDENYALFRNDDSSTRTENIRPFGGTAVYSRLDYYPGYPYCLNRNGVEITVLRFMMFPHITIVGV